MVETCRVKSEFQRFQEVVHNGFFRKGFEICTNEAFKGRHYRLIHNMSVCEEFFKKNNFEIPHQLVTDSTFCSDLFYSVPPDYLFQFVKKMTEFRGLLNDASKADDAVAEFGLGSQRLSAEKAKKSGQGSEYADFEFIETAREANDTERFLQTHRSEKKSYKTVAQTA